MKHIIELNQHDICVILQEYFSNQGYSILNGAVSLRVESAYDACDRPIAATTMVTARIEADGAVPVPSQTPFPTISFTPVPSHIDGF